MLFTQFIADRLGTRNWAVGRRTARMVERYDVIVSRARFTAIRAEYLAARSQAA